MTRRASLLIPAALVLVGCGGSSGSVPSSPGRPFAAQPPLAGHAPAAIGDPPPERNGAVPSSQASGENAPTAGAIAPSPQAALHRYALAYTNWTATSLVLHERALATLAVGPARLAAEQIVASQSATATLAAHDVRNKGVVLAIASGQGVARGQWIVATQEETTGTGPYAGLPTSWHVTMARTTRLGSGWAVSEWSPR
jgi:hypothetical protein